MTYLVIANLCRRGSLSMILLAIHRVMFFLDKATTRSTYRGASSCWSQKVSFGKRRRWHPHELIPMRRRNSIPETLLRLIVIRCSKDSNILQPNTGDSLFERAMFIGDAIYSSDCRETIISNSTTFRKVNIQSQLKIHCSVNGVRRMHLNGRNHAHQR